MRFTSITLFAAFSALAVAQLESLGIPKCALDCFGKNQGDCGPTDVKCLCSNSTLISAIACCVSKDCPAEEQKSTIDSAVSLCKMQGVDIPNEATCPTASGSNPTPTPDQTPASATSATGNAAPQMTAAGVGFGMAVAGLFAAL